MTLKDRIKYNQFPNNKGQWSREHKMLNFIHRECRGDPVQEGITAYKTVTSKDFDECPELYTLDTI